tara:strand:+ start:95 stop:715 length:621 start_codon:yes stop_codon:yes gene_type:complete
MSIIKLITGKLSSSIEKKGTASFVVSGGTSPIKVFDQLSNVDLPWSKVHITLVDDRLVEPKNHNSNQKLISEFFLKNKAKTARFFPLSENLIFKKDIFKLPFDVTLLGMGEDGHFASLFPNMIDNFDALNIQADFKIFKTSPHGEPFLPRITMNLSLILNSEIIILLVKGKTKLKVFNEAYSNEKLPIHYLLNNKKENLFIEKLDE